MKKKVLVGLSGGVDSSVAAYLLKQQGYEVIGVTMQVWPKEFCTLDERENGCCGISAIHDARSVADKLGIPYHVLNFRDVFKKQVIDDFCKEYKEGRTPNPCVRCNKYIKFDEFLKKARQLGASFIATGHHAVITFDEEKNRYLLAKGKDDVKDQAYFLYTMTQEQLAHTLMPIGSLTKQEVRKIASKIGLCVADKKESQEICFVIDNNYHNFLKDHIPDAIKPGDIVDIKGKVLGKHKGLPFYTIGQRRGLGIAAGI